MSDGVSGLYYDGRISRAHAVTLHVEGKMAILTGEAERRCALAELRVSERSRHAPRKVTFPDGAYVEVQDSAAFAALLHATGYRDSLVVRWQQNWRATLAAIVATLSVLAVIYLFVLPPAARAIAFAVPEGALEAAGRRTLAVLDAKLLARSALPAARQHDIASRFAALAPPDAATNLALPRVSAPHYQLLFRKSRIGPNAFALPSNQIVLTDELVALLGDDNAILAVLAHELGHLHERHALRQLVQSATIGAAALALFGDASSFLANLPIVMLDLRYSRHAETEADDYAVAMLRANGLPAAALVNGFDKMRSVSEGNNAMPYLSSHPSIDERIDRLQRR